MGSGYFVAREFDLDTNHWALTWSQAMKDRNAKVKLCYLGLQYFWFNIRQWQITFLNS